MRERRARRGTRRWRRGLRPARPLLCPDYSRGRVFFLVCFGGRLDAARAVLIVGSTHGVGGLGGSFVLAVGAFCAARVSEVRSMAARVSGAALQPRGLFHKLTRTAHTTRRTSSTRPPRTSYPTHPPPHPNRHGAHAPSTHASQHSTPPPHAFLSSQSQLRPR